MSSSIQSNSERVIKPLTSRVAARIVDHLRREAVPAGRHLAEQKLADALHVSRSPIHEALQLLEQEGIVEFKRNCGFFVAVAAEKISNLSIEIPLSIEEEKYRQIAEDRIKGNLHGHISEAELITRYGVSRVKLMKILMRMSQEGWVERRPGHGWDFFPVLATFEELDQGYRFRLLIEPSALLEPTYRVDPILFTKLRQEQEDILASPIARRTSFRMFETGARFHEQIVACSGNRFFLEAIQNVNRLRRLIEYSVKVDEARTIDFAEHLEILAMLEQGKRATASALLRDHIDHARIRKTAQTEPESAKEVRQMGRDTLHFR